MPWAEWALVATCVLWAAAQRTAASGCHYGTLPGCWIRTASRQTVADQGKELVERFPVWQPYSLGCQLKPLLLDYLTGADPSEAASEAPLSRMGVLLIGDSVDYRLPKFLCNLALAQEPQPFSRGSTGHELDPCGMSGMCNVSRIAVAKQHISSASLDGPYWNNIEFRPLPSITEGLQLFEELHGGPPNIVSVASNFWDLASQYHNGGHAFKGTVLEHEFLPAEFLQAWMHNFTAILTHLREGVPADTLLVFHTLHVPRHTLDPAMWEADAFLPQHVAQLNAAGRQVATQLHYHILDIEMMAAQMSPATALIDTTHFGPDFAMQVLNMLLNMELAHREALQDAAQQPSSSAMGGWIKWQRQTYFRGRRLAAALLGV